MKFEPIVTFESLAVGYGRQAILQGLDAQIVRGDSIGMLGANGSGKTTLLKTIAGVLPPISGNIEFTRGKRPVVGYVPQRESLDGVFLLSSFEVVVMGLCGRVGPGRFIGRTERAEAFKAMERTGVADLARRAFVELSGGQKQRVLIARALVAEPELLLLDEPTAGVDPAATMAISELLEKLNAEGMTLVMANHEVPVIRRVSRRIFWVRNGMLEQGSVEEMLNREQIEELPVD